MPEDKVYFKCLVPDCPEKEVFDYWPTLSLHYVNKHPGTPRPKKEEAVIKEIPVGFQLHIAKNKPAKTTSEDNSVDTSEETSEGASARPQTAGRNLKDAKKDRPRSPYKEVDEPSVILKGILDRYPGLEDGAIAEVMDMVDIKGPLHPMEVRQLLGALAGVPKGAVEIIPQKYALALAKAQSEGNAQVHNWMTAWGGNFNFRPIPGLLPFNPNPGLPGNTSLMTGVRFDAMGNLIPVQTDQSRTDRQDTPADIERTKRMEAIEKTQSEIVSTLQALMNQITETEQQKKEAALNARLEKLETLILNLANSPKTDEAKDSQYERLLKELEATRSEVAKIKDEATNQKMSSLEASVKALSEQIKSQEQLKIEQLEKDVEAARTAKAPIVGKTEMDVVSELAGKAIDTIKDAGKDVRGFLMKDEIAKSFNPARASATARKEAGEKIAEVVEEEAAVIAAEEAYLLKR